MATAGTWVFTSESVSEGHPDKVADYISDSILDAHLTQDPHARVACETLVKDGKLVLAGEITSRGSVDAEAVARKAVQEIGYTDEVESFCAHKLDVLLFLSEQAREIGNAVTGDKQKFDQGAGDQGIMFGYASNETAELMPLPILLAHNLSRTLAEHRHQNRVNWLRPDSKTQVSVKYNGTGRPVEVTDVLVSTQHTLDASQEQIRDYIEHHIVPAALGKWNDSRPRLIINPSGSFVQGGPSADAGVTGRKIIVDSYGGMGRHGGGAFSGKDPSKVDRSGAYFCRFVAREVVAKGFADRAEIQVSYAIGVAQPVSVKVETFGTGDERAAEAFVKGFDFRPAAIIEQLDLLRPIYRSTTNYGHFGKPDMPWERSGGNPSGPAIPVIA